MILRNSTHAITLLLMLQSAIITIILPSPSAAIDNSILITPSSNNKNNTLIKNGLFYLPKPNYNNYAPPLYLKSDIPVSLLRYAHSSKITGNNVIDANEMYVYVTTNCSSFDEHYNVMFRKQKDDDTGYVTDLRVQVRRLNDDAVSPLRMVDFLPKSSFVAEWNYTSIWCEAGVPFGNRKLQTKYIRRGSFDNRQRDNRHLTASGASGNNIFDDNASGGGGSGNNNSPSSSSCTIMAEILYDGCQRDVQVKAPLIKINDVTLKKITESKTEEECKTHYDAKMKDELISVMEVNNDDNNYVSTGQLSGIQCRVVVEGRPFVDVMGHQLQAEARMTTEKACWSATTTTTTTTTSEPILTVTSPPTSSSTNLASDWTQRALGEHASIASFAAFTISLMTNNAPPDLIRDALYAALDEVNHATVSFDTASLLSQQIIEPGALPPSSHDFATDMGGLLRGTFEEGCRDETMSALKAAMEAEEVKVCEEEDCEMRRVLSERLRVIAVDEARHAALAWRTMRWGCSVDEVSCRAIVTRYESLEDMWEEMEGRSSTKLSEEVKRNWERIHEVLMPLVTGAMTMESSGVECGEEVRLGGDFVEEVADRVIREVVCGRNDGSSRSDSETKTTVEVE